MSIGSVSVGTRKCVHVGGARVGITRCQLKFRVTQTYRVELLVDGQKFGGYEWTARKRFKQRQGYKEEIDTVVYVDLPSDGRDHSLVLKDVNSSEQSTGTSFTSIGCNGGIAPTVKGFTENPATGDLIYTIELEHTGTHNRELTGVVYLSGIRVGSEITLRPRQKAQREVVVPASGDQYTISCATYVGKTPVWRTLWFRPQSNLPPVIDPGVWTSTTTFDPGETVVVTSAVGDVPMETDGSEWLRLEYSAAGANTWFPLDLVEPSSDGTWSYQIHTGLGTPFLLNTSWDVRVTRYKDYRQSQSNTHTFTVGSTPYVPPGIPVTTPTITAPQNGMFLASTTVHLQGFGPPGARLFFWSSSGPTPASVTVNKDGTWRTWVRAGKLGSLSYKRVEYLCTALLNGRYSAWSDPLSIRWNQRW